MDAEILSIGDEVVRGFVLDANAAFLSRELEAAGARVRGHSVVGDDAERGAARLAEATARSDVVVATGGLGPTEDDRTREILRRVAGVDLRESPEVRASIEAKIRRRGLPFSDGHALQALVPEGAEVLPNPVGTAPGFRLTVGRCTLYVLPGVPHEMEAIFRESVLPALVRSRAAAVVPRTRVVRLFGIPESVVGTFLRPDMTTGADPEIGITASGGIVSVCLTSRRDPIAERDEALDRAVTRLRSRFGPAAFGEGDATLASVVGEELIRRRLRIAIAESCTGGMLSAMLADVPGISEVFVEGAVTYHDGAKTRRLGVRPELLERHGAVSEPVARAMAEGIAERAGVPIGVAVTGIAGPGGGSEAKPVGTVYLAVRYVGTTHVDRCRFHGDRARIRLLSSLTALDRIRRAIAEEGRGDAARPAPGEGSFPFDIEIREC